MHACLHTRKWCPQLYSTSRAVHCVQTHTHTCIHAYTQVVPPALLDFSRGAFRAAVSSTLGRRVYTLLFERNDSLDRRIYDKLRGAAEVGAVVITTPT